MNKLIIILSASLLFSNCNNYTEKRERRLHDQGKIHCGWYGKKTIAECRKMYPFNEAAKIVLVSFPNYEKDDNTIYTINDTIIAPTGEKLLMPRSVLGGSMPVIITRPVLDTMKVLDRVYFVYEKTELNDSQIDSLSNLCQNFTTNYRLKYGSRGISCCYKPRNAILFFDKKNMPIMNFEICFECGQYRCFTPNALGYLSQIDECGELYGLFKNFFRKNGIHYGLDSSKINKR
jgi:hypothetical protein